MDTSSLHPSPSSKSRQKKAKLKPEVPKFSKKIARSTIRTVVNNGEI
jgi:hypothetical protein